MALSRRSMNLELNNPQGCANDSPASSIGAHLEPGAGEHEVIEFLCLLHRAVNLVPRDRLPSERDAFPTVYAFFRLPNVITNTMTINAAVISNSSSENPLFPFI